MVESEGFKHMINVLCPNYKIPNRNTFANSKIPALYLLTKNKIIAFVKEAKWISCTAEGWASQNGQQFISLSIHFIDNYKLNSFMLACRELSENHTEFDIANIMQDILGEYNIKLSQIIAITTDDTANIIAAVKHLDIVHIPCFAQIVNTCIQKILCTEFVNNIISKSRKINNILTILRTEFEKCQENVHVPKKKMPATCGTRWWSELKALVFLTENQLSLYQFFIEQNIPSDMRFTDTDYKHIQVICKMLKPIEGFVMALGSEVSVSASCVFSLIKKLESKAQAFEYVSPPIEFFEFKKTVDNHINNISHIFNKKDKFITMKLAEYLDPRINVEPNQLIYSNLLKLSETNEYPSTRDSALKPKTGLARIFDKRENIILDENKPLETRLQDEMNIYMKTSPASFDINPLIWWQDKVDTMPILTEFANKYLSIQATSVSCDRIFSKDGCLITKMRAFLTGEHAEEHIFLSMNKNVVSKVPSYIN